MTPPPAPRHGPNWQAEGVQFRLWAPSALSVDVLLNDHAPAAMTKTAGGWYEYTCPQAKDGDDYFFLIDGTTKVPDPASHFQPDGVAGASRLIKPQRFAWNVWQNRPWDEAVIYELHVGTFTPEGTYRGVEDKLGYLASLGVTAIELMPVAAFEGRRGWGYDGVYPYAPHAAYGKPEDLKRLINAAHRHGIMVFLDVVYNHFGPAGNYLHAYAKPFFTDAHQTPWGSAMNMGERAVRDFYIDNALYWLNDYNFDGLRFDAVHAIADDSAQHILYELAATLRRHNPDKHLILENDNNQARYLDYDAERRPRNFTAQWNDDLHHVLHVLLTGETDSYYEDYKDAPLARLGRCLTQGFVYQGDASPHRKGAPRGEKSGHLPPQAFVAFLQNHDQIGNRALGERLTQLVQPKQVDLAMTLLMLAPQICMLFMGEEWASRTPFLYFCDFDGDLADKVREGRRNEFKNFPSFSAPDQREAIPDPNDQKTFAASHLNWHDADSEPCQSRLAFTTQLLRLRREHILPLLKTGMMYASCHVIDNRGLQITWGFNGGALDATLNFSAKALDYTQTGDARLIRGKKSKALPPWESVWHVRETHV